MRTRNMIKFFAAVIIILAAFVTFIYPLANSIKQVNKLRVLFRVIVTHISTHLSMSNMVLFFFMIIPFSWLR